MKTWNEKTWGLFVMTIVSLMIMVHVSCGTVKTVEKCDTEKKEKACCSKK
jgi:hypothetical protein